jgi:sec-independent protein translocase protein TatB
MIFGLTIEKLVVIGVIAALLLGPERIPRYAQMLAQLTVRARDLLSGAKSRMRDEMGEDFDDVDWRKLDPRQYDPRRIIREALLDDAPTTTRSATADAAAVMTTPVEDSRPSFRPGEAPPFDTEAT